MGSSINRSSLNLVVSLLEYRSLSMQPHYSATQFFLTTTSVATLLAKVQAVSNGMCVVLDSLA
jgi:hypothetical protein